MIDQKSESKMIFYSLLISAITLVCILIYLHVTRNFTHWKIKNIPYVQPKPFVGTTFSVFSQRKSIAEYLREVYKMTNFCCMGFFIFDKPVLLARDPKLVKLILMNDFDHFEDRNIVDNLEHDKLSGYSLLMLRNPAWRNARTRFATTLSLRKVKSMLPLILEASEDFVHYINAIALNEESTESRELCIKYSLDVFVSYAIGIRANSFDNSEFYKMARNLQNFTLSRVVQSVCYFFAHSLAKLFRMTFLDPQSVEFIKHVFLNNIQRRRKLQETRGDLIDLLLEINSEDARFQLDVHGLAISLEYITAGYVSSASTLAFLLYHLGTDASIQNHVRDEIRTTLGNHPRITLKAVQEMKYLDMCVKETLRKYPVLGFLDRCCTKTYKIPNTDIVIDKGTPVYISLYGLQNDARYFPEPERFEPERFSLKNVEPYAYLPFGDGRRGCLGVLLGNLTVKIAIIQLLLNFEIKPSPKTPPTLKLESFGFITAPEHESIALHFKKLSDLKD